MKRTFAHPPAKRMRRKCIVPVATALLFSISKLSLGQLSYDTADANYTQNFDGVLTTVPANNTVQSTPSVPEGWTFVEAGNNANTSYRVHNGSTTSGDTFLFGATSSTERALGAFASGSLVSQLGIGFVNDTGTVLTEFTVSYTGEQWKDGNSTQAVRNTLTFAYGLGATALDAGTFEPVVALDLVAPVVTGGASDISLDGNSPANQVTPSATIANISWQPGQTLWLRWSDLNDAGNDDGLAVDNFSFSATAGGPGTLAFGAANYAANEGAGNATLTVTRTDGSGGTVTVDYTTSNGTATQPGDYTLTAGTLSFGPGETSKTIQVPVIEDLLVEGNETLTLTLSNVTGGATLGVQGSSTVTIEDNDNGGILQLAAADFAAAEATGTVVVTVSRTGGTTGAVSVNYATSNGTAIAPGDYTAASGTLNFADGETSKTFAVTLIDESTTEPSETINITLSNPIGAVLGSLINGTVTILNDDAPFVLLNEVKINPPADDQPYEYIEIRGTPGAPLDGIYVVSVEGDRATATATNVGLADVVFNLSGQTLGSNGLLIIKATSGGHTAAPGTTVVTSSVLDGSILENGTNSFAVIYSPTAAISVGVDYDTDENGTLDLPLGAAVLDVIGWADGDAFDVVPGGVVLAQSTGTPDAASRFPTDDTPLSASAWYNGDMAGATNDSVNYDSLAVSSNFPIGGALTPGAPNSPSVGGVMAFSSATYTGNESEGQIMLTVSRTGGILGTVTVDYATSNGTAVAPGDFTTTSGTLTFLENELSQTITVPIINDGTPEALEDFTVALSNPLGTDASLGAITTSTVSIRDSAGSLQLANSSYVVSEGTASATITITRINGTTGGVSVDYATAAGTATAGSDYTETTGTLSLGDGIASGTFNIPLLNDGDIEAAETVTISLTNATGGATIGSPSSGTLLITDDDGQFVRLNEIKVNPPTGNDLPNEFIEVKGTPSATLSGIYIVAVDGNVGANLGKADLVFDLSGQTVGTNGLILIKSTTDGPEAMAGTTVFTTAALDVGSLQPLDNDSSSFLVIYSPTSPIVQTTDYDTDDNGVLELPIGAVVLDAVGWRDGGATDLVYGGITFLQATGTPDAATRFPDNDAAFSAAAWYNGDLLFGSADPAEIQYDVNPLFLSTNFPAGGLLTPGDTNAPKTGAFSIASSTYSVDEGAAVFTITVNRVGGLTGAATVDFATANGTAIQPADYSSASGTLTFAEGETSQTLDLFVEDDTIVELDETFTFTLSNPTGGSTLGANPVSTITIQDNDGAGLVSLDQSTYSILEGAGTLSVTVNRFGGTGEPFTVNYATTAGTATAGTDYTAASGTLSFAQDETFKTIEIPIISDALSESAETLTLTLSGVTGTAVLSAPSSAVITIESDDPPALVLNEIKINPAGSPDEPYEYVEIRGNPGETLPSGTMLVVYEGDSGTSLGFADIVIDLGGQTLGSNGLLIMKSSTGGHSLASETTVVTDPLFTLSGGGLENGTGTFALWFSPTTPFTEGTDYDTNNDGTLESPLDALLLDTVGISDGGASDFVYGGIVLAQSSGTPDAATRFPGNTAPISLAAWYNADLLGTPADLNYDGTKASANFPIDGILTPGASNIGTPPPDVEIAVFDGAAITDPELIDGQAGVVAFGSTPVGTPVTRSFTIRNSGTEAMTISGVAVPAGFTALSSPSSVAAGSTATFQVRFDATSAATATGSVSISSTDQNENPFNFPVSATAASMLTHHQDWRQTYFGNSANSGDGADGNDFDKDGLVNLIEYALGTNPTLAGSSGQLPTPELSGGNLTLTITQPTGVTGITYGAEYSTNLNPTGWLPVTGVYNAPVHTFSQAVGTNEEMFMRIVITNTVD